VRNIVLIGFMGTGKSEVGQFLARRLGWAFVDTDRKVEMRERATVAQIFARHGEARFRQAEVKVVEIVAARPHTVIATGGGVVLRPENMKHLRRHGWIVCLTAPVDVLVQRLGNARSRPLLRGNVRENITRLLDERRPLYRDADLMIDVSQATPERIVEAIMAFVATRERVTVPVRLGDRAYSIHVGDGILPLLPVDLSQLGAGRKVAVLSHPPLLRRMGDRLLASLSAWGYEPVALTVPAGEPTKSLAVAASLYSRLARARCDRSSTVLAVGGGVVGDLGGFVAATYMRGIRLIQVPTTLLAMVDSAIGGKTGVNHAGAKNLVGAFYQPALTVADVQWLVTLPERELRSGLAEVIKTAVIGDAGLFDYLEQHLSAVLRRDTAALVDVIARCAAFKARVVEADEREQSERRILNYGHTIGHAVEAATGFRRLSHGEAVAIGMAMEAGLAQRMGLAAPKAVERQNALLARAGLPTHLGRVRRTAVWRAIGLDKKIRDGVLRCPLLVGIGEVAREQEVPDTLLREVLVGGKSTGRLRTQPQSAR
jgi:shikimate kinase / 3-dehydroquinate synthase